MRNLFTLFLFCSFLLFGCSGSGTSATSPPPGEVTTQAFMYSEVRVVSRIRSVNVRLEDLAGNELATGTPDANGFVTFRNVAVPQEFRAVSELGGVRLRLDVSNFASYPAVMRISLLSTLQSLYREAHPELSRDEIDRRLRIALSLPPTLDLAVSLFEPNPVFSDLAFLREGARRGDWDAFLTSVLEDAEAGRSHAYRLTEELLTTPISAPELDQQLVAAVETARQRLPKDMRFDGVNASRSQRVLIPFISLVATPDTLGGNFLLGVGTGITGNLIGAGTKAIVGWAANQMGLNYGTGAQLEEIDMTLEQILNILTALSKMQAEATLEQQLRTVADILEPVQANTMSLQAQAAAAVAPNSSSAITNTPFTPINGVSSLVANLTSPNYTKILSDTHRSLFGAGNPLQGVLSFQMTNSLGIDANPLMNGAPWNTSLVLATVMEPYDFFAGAQVNGLNLLAEQAHNSFYAQSGGDPAVGVQMVLPTFRQTTQNLKLQRQQLPLIPSAQIMLDMENGIQWYNEAFAPDSWENATTRAESWTFQMVFPDGSTAVYDDWRLPVTGECFALQDRGTYSPQKDPTVAYNTNGSYPDIGNSAAGLTALGFNSLSLLNSDGSIWQQVWNYNSKSNEFSSQSGQIFELNHEGGNQKGESSDQNFVWVRTFGDQSSSSIVFTEFNDGAPSRSPVPTLPSIDKFTPLTSYGVQGRPLLPGEFAQWGVCTSISDLAVVPAPSTVTIPPVNSQSSPTVIPIPTNSLQLQATLNFTVTLGGEFVLGTAMNSSTTNPTVTYQGSASTALAAGSTNPSILQEWVIWDALDAAGSSSTEVAQVLNLPGLDGIVIPYQTLPTTFQAQVLGVTATLAYTPSAIAEHTLQSIQITPRNIEFGTTSTFPASGNFPIACTGFYADRTLESLAGTVTWTVTPTNNPGNVHVVSTGPATASLQIAVTPGLEPYVVTVTATDSSGAFTDSTQFKFFPPPTSTQPVVNLVVPNSGTAGTNVTLTGSNLSGVTQVTVNGVAVTNFFASTDSELTINGMPAGTPGQLVPIVVTSPSGSAPPANFLYTN